MLATFPTYIARSKRQRRAFPIIEVQQFTTARAAIQAAEKHALPVVLSVQSDPSLVRGLLSLAQVANIPVLVTVRCRSIEDAEQVLALGVQGITVQVHDLPQHGRKMYLESLVAVLASRDVSLFLEWDAKEKIPTELAQSGIHGLILRNTAILSPLLIKELIEHLLRSKQIPVFLHADELKPRELQQYLKAGILGYFVSTAVEEAYTAGLRTGLRNHALTLASEYEHYAVLAAQETTERILINHTKQ